ncbi:hypothetical protein [Bacillus sp. V2I10]|uniref:hypothetical protein n=1 Tax=Bacillus sp. V2I10 TaxID=3042276 RepID=UPI00277F5C8E|nr:hypothetical protein [Bacillus sp. V2I10]MDQ0857306.1 hypothetical protein [Bacillus sp. V2I10]
MMRKDSRFRLKGKSAKIREDFIGTPLIRKAEAPVSSDRQIRIRQKRRFLPLLAEELGDGARHRSAKLYTFLKLEKGGAEVWQKFERKI